MENLPQNWVIDAQKEKDSPLMPKFMEWIEKNRTVWVFAHYKYYGAFNNIIGSYYGLSEFQTVITLEQWNAFYFPEWEPKQGEVVLVSKNGRDFAGRIFAFKYKDLYYCENLYTDSELIGFNFIERMPKESTLQPIMDQLKAEAEKLGLKVNITVE